MKKSGTDVIKKDMSPSVPVSTPMHKGGQNPSGMRQNEKTQRNYVLPPAEQMMSCNPRKDTLGDTTVRKGKLQSPMMRPNEIDFNK